MKLNLIFWCVLLFHAVFWTFAPLGFAPNYRMDTLELMVVGQHWVLSTWKHPAMQSWILETLGLIFRRAEWVPYLATQLAVVGSVTGVWCLAKKYLSPKLAVLAALALLGFLYFHYDSLEFNNRTFMRMFWVWAIYFFFSALESQRWRDWVLIGIALAAGIYCKFTALLLPMTMVGFLIWNRESRHLWRTPGPYLTIGVCLALCAPLAWWLIDCNFAPFSYAQGSLSRGESGFWGHLTYPLLFVVSLFGLVAPTLIPLLPLSGLRWRFVKNAPDQKSRFLAFMIFVPISIALALAAIKGYKIRTAMGCQFCLLIPLYFLTVLKLNPDERPWRRGMVLALWNVIFFAMVSVAVIVIGPKFSKHGTRVHFPGRQLATEVERLWAENVPGAPLEFVRGDDWPTENVAVYASTRPNVFGTLWNDTNDDFQARGGVLLWMENRRQGIRNCFGNPDFTYSPEAETPEEWLAQFPTAKRLPTLELPMQTRYPVPPARICIAIVPPSATPVRESKALQQHAAVHENDLTRTVQ